MDSAFSLGLPSCFYSELSFKRLLFPLWLIVCLINYSNMSQLTSVQLSCILHIKKQRHRKFKLPPQATESLGHFPTASKSWSWDLNPGSMCLFLPLHCYLLELFWFCFQCLLLQNFNLKLIVHLKYYRCLPSGSRIYFLVNMKHYFFMQTLNNKCYCLFSCFKYLQSK